MTYTSRDRDRARRTVTAVTGLGAVGAFTATGWLAGMAAADYSSEQGATGTGTAPTTTTGTSSNRRVEREDGLRQRPYVTRISVRYVPGAARTPAAPAPAGPVSNVAPTPVSRSSSGSSSSSGPSHSSGSGSSGSGSSGTPAAPSSGS